jgi:heavy metal translocating P-type ATPase
MFFQICLLTAAVHAGRTLLQRWQPSSAAPEPAAPADAATAEEAAVQEQFSLALISMGVTTAAALAFPALRVLGGVSVLYGSIPIMARAKELVVDERRVGAEVLDTVGMVTTLAARHFMSASFIFFMYAGSRKLRLRTERAAQNSMIDAFSRRADLVWLWKDGVEVSVPLESLRAGDIVVVDAGSPIPADGIVQHGNGVVDQQLLTGEAQPLDKAIGDQVFATTLVVAGRLHVEVLTTGKATVAAEIAEVLQHTTDFTSSLEARGTKIADALALPTLALGALSYPVVGAHGSRALLNASFLDNMRFFIPFSMLNYLRRAYDRGILIKDGRSLQLLPKVDTIIFDKTGTLTLGQLRVSAIYPAGPAGEAGEADVLTCAAAAEHRQTHPIALAILEEAQRRGQSIAPVDETDYELGQGLTARIGDHSLQVGSQRFMAAHGIAVPEAISERERDSHRRGCSLVYVARDRSLVGTIELEPTVRPEVSRVLGALRKRKVSLMLLSGDHEAPTEVLAQALGFDRYFAGVLPRDKAQMIEDLQAQGRTVCFVGDGINDAIALKKAATSISLGGAAAAATDSAQITLLEGGLGLLPAVFEIADDFERNVRDITIALGVPSALGVGGVFLAGFGVPVMTTLYGASLAAGMAVAMWPHRGRTAGARTEPPQKL